eukprot:NODE_1710_length_905_cov_64.530374_g1190_i0.p5 GENE.NODE_1710_length_905_cov_64.530374_g1190_i0~~NODE_1710_length_905_cov_64.530374_g1190_i0.p5  ORF type:complete len:67 (-),score=0.12 NODE_1710_length_905_cov_64.530374_g1190_i0:223-423(-)
MDFLCKKRKIYTNQRKYKGTQSTENNNAHNSQTVRDICWMRGAYKYIPHRDRHTQIYIYIYIDTYI